MCLCVKERERETKRESVFGVNTFVKMAYLINAPEPEIVTKQISLFCFADSLRGTDLSSEEFLG